MSSQTPGNHRTELEARIVEKAMKDESFRQELLNDPKAAIAKELGMTIPDSIQIQIHEETVDTLHLVLPAKPNVQRERPLSDAELKEFSGGTIMIRHPREEASFH